MTSTTTATGPRVSWGTLVADLVAILVFAILARAAHNSPDDPFTVANILDTWWPFMAGGVVGWVIAMLTKRPLRQLVPGIFVWLCTAATGLIIWFLREGRVPHWSFIIVATVMSGLLLLGWRAVAGIVAKRR